MSPPRTPGRWAQGVPRSSVQSTPPPAPRPRPPLPGLPFQPAHRHRSPPTHTLPSPRPLRPSRTALPQLSCASLDAPHPRPGQAAVVSPTAVCLARHSPRILELPGASLCPSLLLCQPPARPRGSIRPPSPDRLRGTSYAGCPVPWGTCRGPLWRGMGLRGEVTSVCRLGEARGKGPPEAG